MVTLNETQSRILTKIIAEAERQGFWSHVAATVAWRESTLGMNQQPSTQGAVGIMQVMPIALAETQRVGLIPASVTNRDLANEGTNIRVGIAFLKLMFDKYADKPIEYILSAYNFGEGNTRTKWDAARGNVAVLVSSLPAETRNYINVFTNVVFAMADVIRGRILLVGGANPQYRYPGSLPEVVPRSTAFPLNLFPDTTIDPIILALLDPRQQPPSGGGVPEFHFPPIFQPTGDGGIATAGLGLGGLGENEKTILMVGLVALGVMLVGRAIR